jgi:DNA-binding transcriptional LysR family regulator
VTDSGVLAANMLLHTAGAAYLPGRLTMQQPFRRRLHPVTDAPVMVQPLYAQYRAGDRHHTRLREAIALAKQGIR